MGALRDAIHEKDGKVSSMRICMMVVVFVVVGVWAVLTIKTGWSAESAQLLDIPEGPRWVVIAAMGWKAGQKIGEVAKDKISFTKS